MDSLNFSINMGILQASFNGEQLSVPEVGADSRLSSGPAGLLKAELEKLKKDFAAYQQEKEQEITALKSREREMLHEIRVLNIEILNKSNPEKKFCDIIFISTLVSRIWEVKLDVLRSSSRYQNHCFPRYAAFMLTREYVCHPDKPDQKLPVKHIGTFFNRDHSTVISGIEEGKCLMEHNADFRKKYQAAETLLLEELANRRMSEINHEQGL